MLKIVAFTLLLSGFAQADIAVVCKDNCPAVPGSTVVSNASNQTVIKVVPNPDEVISITTADGAVKKRIVVDVDEESQPGNLTVNLSSKIDVLEQKSFDASNGVIVGGHLKSVSLNTSGYRGANGKSASDLCADRVLDGTFDTSLGTGTTIHSNFTARRAGNPSLPATKCDATDIAFIKAQIAPDNTSGVASPMCSTGYVTDPTANVATNFSLRRIAPKRACINNPSTGRQCRFRKHLFQCGFGFGSQYGLPVSRISGKGGVTPTLYWANKRVYAPFYAIGQWPNLFTGTTDMANMANYYTTAHTGVSCHDDCKTGIRTDGWVDNLQIQTLGEKYYEEKWNTNDCSDSSCTVDQFRRSEVNLRAQNFCASGWIIGYGTGCYGNSPMSCDRTANWVSGWPATAANAFYLGLQDITEISSSASESCEALASRRGYSSTYTTQDMGPAVGANTTWTPSANACSPGYTNAGVYNDFSTCSDGSGAALCDGAGDEDSISCSINGCTGGKMVVNSKVFSPVAVTLEVGQKGSNYGSATVVSFKIDGTVTTTVQAGADGDIGVDDLAVVGEAKVCKMVEDEDAFDALSVPAKAASKTASYRSSPRVFIENVDLKPINVLGISAPKTTYQSPRVDQNKVFTHVDNNVRKLILKEAQ